MTLQPKWTSNFISLTDLAHSLRRGKNITHEQKVREPLPRVCIGSHCLLPISRHGADVHPGEKVIVIFFMIKFDRDNQISIDGVWYVLRDQLRKLKSAKYLSTVISEGQVMKHWKKHDINFAMSNSVTELWRRWIYLTIKYAILPKLNLISQTGEARMMFHDFLISFGISDIFVNHKQSNI